MTQTDLDIYVDRIKEISKMACDAMHTDSDASSKAICRAIGEETDEIADALSSEPVVEATSKANHQWLEERLAEAMNLLSQICDMREGDIHFKQSGFIQLDATTGSSDMTVGMFMALVRTKYPEF